MEPMLLGSPGTPPTTGTSPFLPAYLMGETAPGAVSKVNPSSPTKQQKHVSFVAPSIVTPSKFLSSTADSRNYRPTVCFEKASGPPTKCLYDTLDDSFASPAPIKTPERSYHEISASVLSGCGSSIQEKSTAPSTYDDNWVTVFGFPPSSTSFIASLFGSCGLIVDKRTPTKGNWMHLKFQTSHEAHKALSYNGKVFSGSIMLGVIPCQDPEILQESQLKENILESSYSTRNISGISPAPSRQNVLNQSNVSNFSYLGSPVRIGNVRPGHPYRPGQNEEVLGGQGNTPQKSTSMVAKAMDWLVGW